MIRKTIFVILSLPIALWCLVCAHMFYRGLFTQVERLQGPFLIGGGLWLVVGIGVWVGLYYLLWRRRPVDKS